MRPPRDDPAMLAAIRPPQAKVATLSWLSERTAQPVPGLENIDPAFTPCLTPDLLTIIFSSQGNPKTGYDLYEATRESVFRPFGKPRLIKACVSRFTDARPTLSANGLELIFRRTTRVPQFWRSTREATSKPFGTPQPVRLPEDEIAGRELGPAQLVDRDHLFFDALQLNPRIRSYLLATRIDPPNAFASLRRLSFYYSGHIRVYFLSADRLRAYAGGPEGLLLTARKKETDTFDEGVLIVPAAVSGPVEDQIRVAPREDLIVDCSPGPDQKPGSGRKLWMIRF